MEVVVSLLRPKLHHKLQQEHVVLHWSRGIKAMEENLCRNDYRNQPSSRELEVPTRWSCLSAFLQHLLANFAMLEIWHLMMYALDLDQLILSCN